MTEILALVRRALADRYTVEREIGRGGMATVYLARDRRLARPVAVKVLRSELSSSIGVERFRREIDISARLNHPNIVALYDTGDADGLLYYVMPYVEGLSLRDQLDGTGPLPLKQVLGVARDIAAGLTHAHEAGIVHRDINPRNILLSGGRALIADFGIARALQAAVVGDLTLSGIAVGTPAYMSPEQAAGESVIDARADIYGFGCVVYEMLAGEPPFRAATAQGLLTLHMARTAPSLSAARRDVPVAVAETVQRSLAKAPDERFATAGEFFTRLESGFETSGSVIRQLTGRARHWLVRAPLVTSMVLSAIALALVLLGIAAVQGLRSPARAWIDGRPASIVVLPFETASSTAAERALAADMAAVLTTELDAWETIRAVPQVALGGPMFDLGLSGPTLSRVDDGARLARELHVDAFLAVTVRIRADTIEVEATTFDAAGRQAGRPWRQRDAAGALLAMARPSRRAWSVWMRP
ncbi:MAG: serine/threonine protein kinase [Gemmatimonadetes bacterium]|nr:serine/threonine protein kinase [Gemmatimonadota bacterium]